MIFPCTDSDMRYIASRDERMAAAVAKIGRIERECDDDMFSSLVRHIVGQQISTKAQQTIWDRMCGALGEITPESVASVSEAELQSCGISFRKAGCIAELAERVTSGEFDIASVSSMDDADAIAAITSLRGVGVWTAEMILLFCLKRPNILSAGDFGIRRGLCILHGLESIGKREVDAYKKIYSPRCSTASLYIWAIAGGALE